LRECEFIKLYQHDADELVAIRAYVKLFLHDSGALDAWKGWSDNAAALSQRSPHNARPHLSKARDDHHPELQFKIIFILHTSNNTTWLLTTSMSSHFSYPQPYWGSVLQFIYLAGQQKFYISAVSQLDDGSHSEKARARRIQ
jgi:hypothetical protein